MAEPESKKKISSSSIMPDWSQLPEELLQLISTHLENCIIGVIHARSVCSSWRSTFPFPSSLLPLHQSYSLPSLSNFPYGDGSKDLCILLEKVPLFLFRVQAPTTEFLIGGIGRDESEDHHHHHHMELSSSFHFSVKVKIRGYVPKLICQILLLGDQYRMSGLEPKDYKGVAFIPLNNEGGRGGFVVLVKYESDLLVLTSNEMRWKHLHNIPKSFCWSLVSFRGRFYATFLSSQVVVIDPYSLKVTLLLPSPQKPVNYLVPSGNDELFLVEVTIPPIGGLDIDQLTLRVCRLDEEVGKWVEVSDLGDRVLFINELGNFSCSAKELPHDCGVSANSILITHGPDKFTFAYKYGVDTTGNVEDDLHCWRYSRENRVTKLNTSFPVIALQIER